MCPKKGKKKIMQSNQRKALIEKKKQWLTGNIEKKLSGKRQEVQQSSMMLLLE